MFIGDTNTFGIIGAVRVNSQLMKNTTLILHSAATGTATVCYSNFVLIFRLNCYKRSLLTTDECTVQRRLHLSIFQNSSWRNAQLLRKRGQTIHAYAELYYTIAVHNFFAAVDRLQKHFVNQPPRNTTDSLAAGRWARSHWGWFATIISRIIRATCTLTIPNSEQIKIRSTQHPTTLYDYDSQ